MDRKVCILDYGSGNVASVKNSFDRMGIKCLISNQSADIQDSSHLVLPGVGAFKSSMEKIERTLPLTQIRDQVSMGKPFLGICVGLQVLAERGFEFGYHPGLNILSGTEVVELPDVVSKPHVGWNSIEIVNNHPILKNIDNGADFYFVHSYFLSKIDHINILAVCKYGVSFPAIVAKNNVIGVQFHPEKSQNNGDELLKNFFELV